MLPSFLVVSNSSLPDWDSFWKKNDTLSLIRSNFFRSAHSMTSRVTFSFGRNTDTEPVGFALLKRTPSLKSSSSLSGFPTYRDLCRCCIFRWFVAKSEFFSSCPTNSCPQLLLPELRLEQSLVTRLDDWPFG